MKDAQDGRRKGSGCLSHRQIALLLGMTHQQVFKIEQRALIKLRRLMLERGIDAEEVKP